MFEDRWWDDGGPDPVEGVAPWEYADGDVAIDELAAGDPDPDLTVGQMLAVAECAPVVSELGGLDLAVLGDDELVAVMVAAQRRVNHFEAVKLAAVARFAGPEPRDDTGVSGDPGAAVFAWNEIGAALRVGEGAARAVTHHAQRLVSHLPATLAAMTVGDVSYPKVRTLLDATAALTVGQCAEVEARVLGKAGDRNPSQHAKAVARAVRAVDPDGWARRREQKLADVALIRSSQGDGVANMLLRSIDSYDAELLWTAADTRARQLKAAGDPRTLDALRVAAIVAWAADYLTGTPITPSDARPHATQPHHPDGEDDGGDGGDGSRAASTTTGPTRHGQPATVNILIGLPDLADPTGGGAATIAGSGEPLPAEAVAELLRHGARIRFALVDPDGRLAGISTDRHDPTVLQRVFVALRDLTLRVPGGSTTPVAGQDLDHLDPTGPTEPPNLHAPSRGWHRAKTYGHWSVIANPDGTITWTSRRTGRSYTTHPHNHRDDP